MEWSDIGTSSHQDDSFFLTRPYAITQSIDTVYKGLKVAAVKGKILLEETTDIEKRNISGCKIRRYGLFSTEIQIFYAYSNTLGNHCYMLLRVFNKAIPVTFLKNNAVGKTKALWEIWGYGNRCYH